MCDDYGLGREEGYEHGWNDGYVEGVRAALKDPEKAKKYLERKQ